jgi:hypothetical protein
MKDAAIELGVITAPSPSSNTGSWLTTTADVLTTIPKGVVLALAASEVLKAVGAFPTGYNPNHLSAEPADNPDVVHHRSVRAMQNEKITSYVTLENENCVGILLKTVPAIKPYQELRAKCFNERCNNQQFDGYQADYLLEKDQIYTASASTLNPQEAKIEYSYGTRQFQNQMVKEECEGILGIENIGGSKACSRM